ncbi:unnamed protein product [Haemonchus placei]|uniref:Endo/exonuclease/phosphatase domain-containing protein n=1 Tax=Haemonchus placei TaxID=6290 RepID=A0A0N4WEM9_HAEPC|nr:unnamed protein product [Haemonchus placei]
MAICSFNVRTPASEAGIANLTTQARKIKYDVIGMTETRVYCRLHSVFDTEGEFSLGTCDSRVKNHTNVIAGDFDAKDSRRRAAKELYVGTHGMKWSKHGGKLFELSCRSTTSTGELQSLRKEAQRHGISIPPATLWEDSAINNIDEECLSRSIPSRYCYYGKESTVAKILPPFKNSPADPPP